MRSMAAKGVARYVVQLRKGQGNYYYYRRVPIEVRNLDQRTHVCTSLKTDDLKEALQRGEAIHTATERLWAALSLGESSTSRFEQYTAAVQIAQSLGFTYRTVEEVAALDLDELDRRFKVAAEHHASGGPVVSAVLGAVAMPEPRLSDVWLLYEKYNEDGLVGMSPDQLDRHMVSRQRAVRYAVEVLGDMELRKVTRADVLRFREWWNKKIKRENLKAYTANRCFSDLMGMITVIDNALHTDFHKVWEKARIKSTNKTKLEKRYPFAIEWVRDVILKEGAFSNMSDNDEAFCICLVMIETGMRLSEVCNLRPQDIYLDDAVPHVEIADRDDRRQKTEHSIRRVPLVGVALWAMRRHPNGFPRYQDKGASASGYINKKMTEAGLRPTTRHSAYSFRHTFQDRIENASASDRMQADLMGHEFGRPAYGDGAEMRRRQVLLESIRFKPAWLPAEL